MQEIGITKEEFDTLRKKLSALGCISIEIDKNDKSNNRCTEVGYRRIGMGIYDYLIYNTPLSIKEQELFNECYSNVFYRDKVGFTYGGGAIGSDIFQGKEEFLKKIHPHN